MVDQTCYDHDRRYDKFEGDGWDNESILAIAFNLNYGIIAADGAGIWAFFEFEDYSCYYQRFFNQKPLFKKKKGCEK